MNYSYDDLVDDLILGQEVEFRYKSDKYSISVNEKGWYLTRYGFEKYESFNDIWDLLENARIDSMSLRSIWDKVIF